MARRRYRVTDLAERAGVSVDVVRSYQSRGLLPPPEHEGRVAWYDDRHLARLRQIKELKERGWSLKSIAEAFHGEAGRGVREAVEAAVVEQDDEILDVRELAERTGVPVAILRSFIASGVLRPRATERGAVHTSADVNAVRALLSLIGTGVPMEEFMAVAQVQLDAVDKVASGVFDLFLQYLREPLLARDLPERAEAKRLADSLRLLLQSVGTLLAYNFQRTILEVAQQYLDEHGTTAERAALAQEVRRHFELVPLPEGA